VEVVIPAKQSATVTIPVAQAVEAVVPGAQSVGVTFPRFQSVDVIIPSAQSVAVTAEMEIGTPPLLLSGPTVSDITETTARVTWELNPSGPIGFHRVRYRPTAGGEWTVTDWSESASYSAVVDLADLESGTEHDYQVQSCYYSNGSMAFSYAPDPADTFETEAAGDIVFSDFEFSKNPIFQLVILHWHTDVATKDRSRWRIYGSSDQWNYTTLNVGYSTSHYDNTSMPCTPGAIYEFLVYGIDENGYEEWDIERYIRINESGMPVPYSG